MSLNVTKLTSKALLREKTKDLGLLLDHNATVTQMKTCLILHKTKVEKMYTDKGFKTSMINFWNKENDEQPTFSSLCIVDSQLLYAACPTEEAIVAVTTSFDSVGIRGCAQRIFPMEWTGEQYLAFVLFLRNCLL